MASGRLRRNKSLGGYLTSLDQTASNLNTRQNYLTTGLASQSVTESSLAEELTIFNRSIQTDNYVEGSSGWRISGTGDAEFGSVIIRGEVNAYSGTIGYWNISTPAVSRVIGPHSLLGTFIESSGAGGSDVDITSGTYVGLYKSYSPEEILVTLKSRTSNVSTLTAENHQFEVGDFVTVELEDDTTFNNGFIAVEITDITNDTFSYSNAGTDVSESSATGTVQLYNPDVAGLYLTDYGKREFDYGYFSSAGVAYVSAEDMNIIENPSFEYKDGSNVITSSSTSWAVGTGLSLTLQNFTDVTYIGTQTPTGTTNITITTSTPHGLMPNEFVIISNVGPSGYNGFWVTQAGTTGSTLVVNIGSNPGAIVNSGGYVQGLKTYKYGSKFGGRVTWTSSALSTYFEGKLDFAAGSDYSIFANDRVLYFGATLFPYYIPPFYGKSSVARYNLTGTFTSATANATTITYTGSSLTFAAGQWLSVSGFTGTNAARFNITSGQISSANATTVVVQQAGVVQATSSGTGSASVGLFEATTSSTHTFVADDIAFFDFKFGIDQFSSGEITSYFAPHTLPDGTSGYSFKVLSSPAPTSTKFYVSADDVYANLSGTILYEDNVNLDTTARTQRFYDAFHPALDISQIQLKYSNANTTPLSNVVSVATKAQWDAGTNKYYLTTSDKYMLGYLDPAARIPGMTKSDLIIIDADLLDATYKTEDPTGYAAQSDITLQIPGWMYKHDGNGVVSATKITSSTAFGYIADNLYLATNNKAYYGNNLDTNRWYDNTLTNPAQASVEGTKTWIDVDLATQDAQLNYLSRVGFKGTNFSKLLYSNPSISAIVAETSRLGLSSEAESLTVSGGEYQFIRDSLQYTKMMPYLQTKVSDEYTSFELIAKAEDIAISDGAISERNAAGISGYYNSSTGVSEIVAEGLQFRYNTSEVDLPGLYIIRANGDNVDITVPLTADSVSADSGSFTDVFSGTLRLLSTDDITTSSTNHALQIGEDSTINLRIDANEIQTLNNGAVSPLLLNNEGGDVSIGLGSGYHVTVEAGGTGVLFKGLNGAAATTMFINPTGGTVYIGAAAVDTILRNVNAYNNPQSSTTALYVTSGGYIARQSSTRRKKQDIKNIDVSVEAILSVEPRMFKYISDVEEFGDEAIYVYGFIAEELNDAGLTGYVTYDSEGLPDGVQYSAYVSALQAVARSQAERIDSLEARLLALESK